MPAGTRAPEKTALKICRREGLDPNKKRLPESFGEGWTLGDPLTDNE